jgi:glycosyltransferase involved in cell wall biosynthesis
MTFMINAKILNYRLTGVQRYLLELTSRWSLSNELKPDSNELSGAAGHFWEQAILPIKLSGNLLFSPSNSGPILYRNQVVTIHDVVPLDHPEWLNRKFSLWYQFMLPKLAKNVAGIITISEFTKQRILHHIPSVRDKIVVIPNGVDLKFNPATAEEIERVVKKYNLVKGRYVLSVSSIEPRKNISALLSAWGRIESKLDDIKLVVAGGIGASHIFANSNTNNKSSSVIFPGYIPELDLVPLYSGAMCFVYPSLYEGFGLPPLEAMSCGVVPIVSCRTAMPEVVGNGGIYFNPDKENDLAEVLLNTLTCDHALELIKPSAIARAKLFDWDTTARDTLSYLKSF